MAERTAQYLGECIFKSAQIILTSRVHNPNATSSTKSQARWVRIWMHGRRLKHSPSQRVSDLDSPRSKVQH